MFYLVDLMVVTGNFTLLNVPSIRLVAQVFQINKSLTVEASTRYRDSFTCALHHTKQGENNGSEPACGDGYS